jgi:LysM repeat protein
MREDQFPTPSWLIILLLVLGIIAVVIFALLLAQIDTYQRQSAVPSNGPPVIDLEATIAAGEINTIYLPSDASPTPTIPATPTLTEPPSDEVTPEVPAPQIETSCDEAAKGLPIYIVKPGDTLSSIAVRFGLNEETLRLVNCLTRDQVIQGQQIYLPQDSTIVTPASTQCDVPPNWKPYKVNPGDTLPKLARKYGTSVYHIMKNNCLENPQLSTESEIYLPSSANTLP